MEITNLQTVGLMSAQALAGEPWRAVTALTLHAGAEHAASNAAVLLGAGAALARKSGAGVAVSTAICGGAAANFVACAWQPDAQWIGASTAAFAVLGALAAAYRSVALAAIAGGLCYAAHGADVCTTAHVAGLCVGGLAGLCVGGERRVAPLWQLTLALVSVALLALCWALAARLV